jgi:hypothetical protein
MKKAYTISIALLVIAAVSVHSADLAVPEVELITRGYMDGGSFLLATRGDVDFLIAGGYKFGGRILLGFESSDLENIAADRSLQFRGAHIIMRQPLGLSLDLTYFTGELDVFGSGDVFPTAFGSRAIASNFSGYLYFPEDSQIIYNGIHTIDGSGLKISSRFNTDFNLSSLYVYQDSYLGTGHFSLDLHTVFNTEQFKMESFAGVSYPSSTWGLYRAGLLLFYDTGQGGEFLTQIGIPRWDPVGDPFAIDLFYFLFEPRVRFGGFSIILTLFWHPAYYLQTATNELGSIDINSNFQFGNPEKSINSGGIETKMSLSTTATDQFRAIVSPYFRIATSGVIWNFKVNTQVFPIDVANMFEIFIGVRAEF